MFEGCEGEILVCRQDDKVVLCKACVCLDLTDRVSLWISAQLDPDPTGAVPSLGRWRSLAQQST